MHLFSKKYTEKKLLLFIGSPRTGSTLLGQIINYHPNCLVANEFRFLNKVIVDNKNKQKTIKKLEKYALKQFKKGLENDKKYSKTLSQYQQKWKGFQKYANELEFQKREIQLIGDKKAGGNIQIIKDFPIETENLFQKVKELYFIQIIRNPIDAALSLMKSHNVKGFEEAMGIIIENTVDAERFAKESKYNYHFIYYESLSVNAEKELKAICKFLNIYCSVEWLSKVSKTISKPEKKDISEYHKNIFIETLEKFGGSKILEKYI